MVKLSAITPPITAGQLREAIIRQASAGTRPRHHAQRQLRHAAQDADPELLTHHDNNHTAVKPRFFVSPSPPPPARVDLLNRVRNEDLNDETRRPDSPKKNKRVLKKSKKQRRLPHGDLQVVPKEHDEGGADV